MSTFYLLPPRPALGQQFVRFLQTYFPGLDWPFADRADMAEAVAAVAGRQPDVFVVFREDLPEGVALQQALLDNFGAEPGDEVVEVHGTYVQRWSVSASQSAA